MRMEDRIAAARSAVGRLCTTHAHGQCETYTTTKDAHTQRSPAGPSVGRSDGVFSTPPACPPAPNSPTAQQPNSPTTRLPNSPTVQQPNSRLPDSPAPRPRPRPRPRAPALTPQRAPTQPAHTRPPCLVQPPRPAHPRHPRQFRQLRQAARTTARPRGASRGGGWGAALPSGRGARGSGRRGRSLGLLP